MNYLGGLLMFAGLIGSAVALLSPGLALLGAGTGSAMLAMSVLAGWLGAECLEHADRGFGPIKGSS